MPQSVVTNICFINRTRKNIKEVLDVIKSPNHIIDLNKIIPMPPSLRSFTVDSISYQQFYLTKYNNGDCDDLLDLFNKSQMEDLNKFISNISKKRPDDNYGEIMYTNDQKYGAPTWREFSKKYWGLGDSCVYGSSMFNTNTITLNTIKQHPKHIIKKLSQMFPEDTIHIKYASSVPGKYVKSFSLLNGCILSSERISDKRYIYCELYKKNPNIFLDISRNETISKIINHVE